jgi:hypothetical protein
MPNIQQRGQLWVLDRLQDAGGQAAVYSVNGVDTSIPEMVLTEEIHDEEETDNGRESRMLREAVIPRSLVESPRLDATVTVTAEDATYAVHSIPHQFEHVTILRLVRIESIERSKPKYRG